MLLGGSKALLFSKGYWPDLTFLFWDGMGPCCPYFKKTKNFAALNLYPTLKVPYSVVATPPFYEVNSFKIENDLRM